MKKCKYWIELDDERGQLYEYCKVISKNCICSGIKEQCNYLKYFKETKGEENEKRRK